jgi:hypothetical protein
MPFLEIPAQIQIPTCDNCGAEWLDDATARTVDSALEEIYRSELTRIAQEAIERIAEIVPQRRVEELLGLSQGYLSKLRSGDRSPSPELVSHLALIARDPVARLQEIETLWKTHRHVGTRVEA